MTVSDASAIAASVSDPDAFVAIFERHYAAISRYLRRRLSRAIADELAAEVFATAFTRRAAYDVARPNALPWLYGIAANLLRSQARTEERALQTLARTGVDTFVDAEEPSDLVLRSSLAPELARALLDLSPADRDVLLLFAWADLSYEDIGVALGLPVGTVRSRLNRARRTLRRRLIDSALNKEASHG